MCITSFDLIDFLVLILGVGYSSYFHIYCIPFPYPANLVSLFLTWQCCELWIIPFPKSENLLIMAQTGSKWACIGSLIFYLKRETSLHKLYESGQTCLWTTLHECEVTSLQGNNSSFQLLFCFDSITSVCLLGQMFSTNRLWPPSTGFHRRSAK